MRKIIISALFAIVLCGCKGQSKEQIAIDFKIMDDCGDLVKNKLNNPDTYSPNKIDIVTKTVKDKRLVKYRFSAKNKLDQTSNYEVVCALDEKGVSVIQLKEK